MKEKITIGVVGLGKRGFFAGDEFPGLIHELVKMDDVEIMDICDYYQDRVDTAKAYIKEHYDISVPGTTDYMDIVNNPNIDAVVIICSWEMHVPIAVAAMKAGKAVALEVGGAYSVDDCWRLVRTQEETGVYFMLLENCCYDRLELLALNMTRKGLLGEIVHCQGGYFHDLREEVSDGEKDRHYRLRNYLARNCDNYPTHELGPIAKVLNINRGNRMLSLVSMASKAAGLNHYNKTLHGAEHKLATANFAQGDIVTTIIKCAGGETITLVLDTTLPRGFYSRGFTVRGTNGMISEDTKTVMVEPELKEREVSGGIRNNAKDFYERYGSALWEEYDNSETKSGHGGIDWHVLRAFVESYKGGYAPPIDVYDAAAWMSISALSEISITRGGALVEIPDFTNGKWVINTAPQTEWKYSL